MATSPSTPEESWRLPPSILWILLLALALRGLAMWHFDPVTFDSAVYFEMADLIRAGRWSEALGNDFPPLYPALIAAAYWLPVTAETTGLVIALALDLLVLFLILGIARLATGESAAWGAAFLWAIHPSAIRLGVQALTDAPTACFVALALWAGLRSLEEGRLAWMLGAGAASGLAYLLRPEGIEPALALALLCIWHGVTPGRQAAKTSMSQSACGPDAWTFSGRALRRLVWVVAPLAGWAVVASPYVVFLSADAGVLTLSKKKSGLSILRSLVAEVTGGQDSTRAPDAPAGPSPQGLPTGPPHMRGASGQGSPAGETPAEPRVRRMARGAYMFQKPLLNGLHPLLLVFALVAAWRCRGPGTEDSRRARALLLGLLGLHLAVLLGLAIHLGPDYLGRHHFFLMVLYALPFAGAGLAWTLTWAMDRLGGPRWLPAVGLAGLVAIPVGWLATRGPDRGVAVRPAAVWIRSQVVGTPVIVTNIAKLTYHAGAERVRLSGTYEEILARGRARSAQFIAFYPDLLPNVSDDFLPRLKGGDLELVQTFREASRRPPDHRLEIYRLRPR
jgi:hypothetical protein